MNFGIVYLIVGIKKYWYRHNYIIGLDNFIAGVV